MGVEHGGVEERKGDIAKVLLVNLDALGVWRVVLYSKG